MLVTIVQQTPVEAQETPFLPMNLHLTLSADQDDDSQPSEDTLALMQRPKFKTFPKTKAPSHGCYWTEVQPQTHQARLRGFMCIVRSLPVELNQHQPIQRMVIQARNLDEFHQMLQWQTQRANEACLMPSSRSTKIESWFSDPTTLPRSDHSREVTMSTSPTQWPVDVLQRWSDFIQPGTPVYLFVVQPDPPGGQPDIIAHVIVAQNPPADRFAAIVSVTELLDDPWHPTRFCALLPNPVSRNELFDLAGIPPDQVAATPGIGAYHGNAPIPEGSSYPVRHGFAFEVITDTLEFEPDATTLWQHTMQADGQVPVTPITRRLAVPAAQRTSNPMHDDGIVSQQKATTPLHGLEPQPTPNEAPQYQEDDIAEYLSFVQLSFQSIHGDMMQIHAGTSDRHSDRYRTTMTPGT